MPIKNYKPEQIVTILRQIEVQMANGKTAPQACKEAEIHTQTYYRWRKEYGGLKREQAKRLKELEKENGRLRNDRRLVLVDGRDEVGQELTEALEVDRSGSLPNDPVREDHLAVMLVNIDIFPVVERLSIDHSSLDGVIKEVFNL